MGELHTREVQGLQFEIRNDDDGHHLVGLVAPFGAVYDAGSYLERFAPTAFDKTIKERGRNIALLEQHATDRMPIGRAVDWQKNQRRHHRGFFVGAHRPRRRSPRTRRGRFRDGVQRRVHPGAYTIYGDGRATITGTHRSKIGSRRFRSHPRISRSTVDQCSGVRPGRRRTSTTPRQIPSSHEA